MLANWISGASFSLNFLVAIPLGGIEQRQKRCWTRERLDLVLEIGDGLRLRLFAIDAVPALAICSKRRLRKGTWGETRWKALDEIYKICILLHRSDLKFSQKSSTFFREWIMNFRFFIFVLNFAFFLRNFVEMLSGFRDKFQKRVTRVAFSIEFAKKKKNLIAENSEICKNYSLLFIVIHSCP